jgi:hypothetical protein
VDVLSRFLDKNRTSARSTTLIADRNNGKIIAVPNKQKGVRVENEVLKIATLSDIDDPDVREAYRQHARADTDSFVFKSPTNGEDLIAAFANFPDGFGQPWQVITLTPIDDFVGTLKATNRLMMIVIIILTMVELFFIYFASGRLSRPVENVSQQLQAIESLQFDLPASRPSKIREIARLESTASLLRTSLKSFSSFVPLDVVRQLIKSGIPLTLGVEPRFLTVVLFRSGEFFQPLRDPRAERSSGPDLDLPLRKSRPRYRKRVARSTSSSATASWHSGMPRFNASTTSYAPAPAPCGGTAHGASQRWLGGGRTATNPDKDRAQFLPSELDLWFASERTSTVADGLPAGFALARERAALSKQRHSDQINLCRSDLCSGASVAVYCGSEAEVAQGFLRALLAMGVVEVGQPPEPAKLAIARAKP